MHSDDVMPEIEPGVMVLAALYAAALIGLILGLA
jgi:hypothetical protein